MYRCFVSQLEKSTGLKRINFSVFGSGPEKILYRAEIFEPSRFFSEIVKWRKKLINFLARSWFIGSAADRSKTDDLTFHSLVVESQRVGTHSWNLEKLKI